MPPKGSKTVKAYYRRALSRSAPKHPGRPRVVATRVTRVQRTTMSHSSSIVSNPDTSSSSMSDPTPPTSPQTMPPPIPDEVSLSCMAALRRPRDVDQDQWNAQVIKNQLRFKAWVRNAVVSDNSVWVAFLDDKPVPVRRGRTLEEVVHGLSGPAFVANMKTELYDEPVPMMAAVGYSTDNMPDSVQHVKSWLYDGLVPPISHDLMIDTGCAITTVTQALPGFISLGALGVRIADGTAIALPVYRGLVCVDNHWYRERVAISASRLLGRNILTQMDMSWPRGGNCTLTS